MERNPRLGTDASRFLMAVTKALSSYSRSSAKEEGWPGSNAMMGRYDAKGEEKGQVYWLRPEHDKEGCRIQIEEDNVAIHQSIRWL